MGMQAAASAASAVSSYYQGKWAKQLAEYNAKVATEQGKYAWEKGLDMQARQRIQTGTLLGAQRVSYAGQNVVLDDGTALDVASDTRKWGEIDAITVRNNAALEVWGYKQSAINSRIQGQMAYAQGISNAMGSLLQGGANIAAMNMRAGGGAPAPAPTA